MTESGSVMDLLAERMLPVARESASRLRSGSGEAAGRLWDRLSRQELYGLLAVSLAMVDVDRPVPELLEWWDPQVAGPRVLEPCGTEGAYRRHKRNGDEECGICWRARAVRKREARAAARSDVAA